jgi:hypothetical protein
VKYLLSHLLLLSFSFVKCLLSHFLVVEFLLCEEFVVPSSVSAMDNN